MTSEIEEAVAAVDAFVAHLEGRPGALAFGSGKTLRPKILRTLLSALTTSQAEIERLTRERDEAREVCSAHLDLEQHWNREYHKAQQRAQAAEARATRAEALLKEAGEVVKDAAAVTELFDRWKRDSAAGAIGEGAAAASLLILQRAVGVAGSAARAFLDKLKGEG